MRSQPKLSDNDLSSSPKDLRYFSQTSGRGRMGNGKLYFYNHVSTTYTILKMTNAVMFYLNLLESHDCKVI